MQNKENEGKNKMTFFEEGSRLKTLNLLVMNEQHFKALSDAQRGETFLDSKIWTYHLT